MTNNLKEALNRILKWIKQYKPRYVEYLHPGLSREEIDNITKELPIKLPDEIYELYQWKNGVTKGDLSRETAWLFQNCAFKPLQDIIAQYKKLINHKFNLTPNLIDLNQFNDYFNNFSCLNIFYEPLLISKGKIWINDCLHFSPITFECCEEGELSVYKKYSSLTSMMLTIAECYETGDSYINNDGFISYNVEQEHKIWLKYNSNIIKFALQALQHGKFCGRFFIYFSEDLIKFKPKEAVEPLIKGLQSLDNSHSYNQIENPFTLEDPFTSEDPLLHEDPRGSIIKILGEIGDIRALEVISKFVENERYTVRKAAQSALIKLRQIKNETG